jgi:preprotein translocase subunit SecF
MMRLFADTNIDFMRLRGRAYFITLGFVAVGLGLLTIRGLNESIEFTGGTLVQITTTSPETRTADLRAALAASGITGAEIKTFGAPNEFVIRAHLERRARVSEDISQQTAALIDSALAAGLGVGAYRIERREAVSPKVGGELRTKALMAILLSFGATLIYLWFRFEWRFGIAAVVATIHDILATVAFIGMIDLEVTLVVVAAILTIVGYSLNDTIVVFDRVRENLRKFKRAQLYDILNRSVNETLPRTIMTGGTTLAATIALLMLGGEVIRGFAWVMTFGIITGTFSSIYIASPILFWIEQRWPGEDTRGAKVLVPKPTAASAT